MLTSGDVVQVDLGVPEGREAGFLHPAVLITAQRLLDRSPTVLQVVPLTSTLRGFESEVAIAPDGGNGLQVRSSAQCQHVRAIATGRIQSVRGNVGPVALHRIRDTLGALLDIP